VINVFNLRECGAVAAGNSRDVKVNLFKHYNPRVSFCWDQSA
jgi:hypothetical protein